MKNVTIELDGKKLLEKNDFIDNQDDKKNYIITYKLGCVDITQEQFITIIKKMDSFFENESKKYYYKHLKQNNG